MHGSMIIIPLLCPVFHTSCSYGFSPAISAYRAFGFSCNGKENTLADCVGAGAVCQIDSVDHALAVECGGNGPRKLMNALILMNLSFFAKTVELLLIGGQNGCQGLLVQRPLDSPSQRFGLSCDLDAGVNEARAICRHIGCSANGARRAADPTV